MVDWRLIDRLFRLILLLSVGLFYASSVHAYSLPESGWWSEVDLTAYCETDSNGVVDNQVVVKFLPNSYQSSEKFNILICNNTAHAIFIPIDPSLLVIQKWQSFQWLNQEIIWSDKSSRFLHIAPRQKLTISLMPPDATPSAEIIASSPVSPIIYDGDLRDLPALPVWQVGDPIREVPRGGVSLTESDPNFNTHIGDYTFLSLTINELEYGICRIMVRYSWQTDFDAEIMTVYSDNFTVFNK